MEEDFNRCVTMKLPHRIHCPGHFTEMLRKVPVRDVTSGNVYPYQDAYISLERIDPSALSPCQRYVLGAELKKVQGGYWHMFEEWDIDIFNMVERNIGYIEGFTDPPVDILPIIVEEHFIAGKLHMVICDGMHRAYLARQMHSPITVAYIRGASEPYYAFPLSGGWNEVQLVEEISSSYIKKFHAYGDYKAHFRDFTKVFNNVSVSRPRSPDNK